MPEIENSRIDEYFKNLIGKKCTGFAAGAGTGSNVYLEFEPRRSRARPLRNPHLSDLQRRTDADFAVFVQCAWRLDSESKVICGSEDDESAGGRMLQGLALLEGMTLDSAELTLPGLDVRLTFGCLVMSVFCNNVSEMEQLDNYVLYGPSRILCVGPNSRLSEEIPGAVKPRSLRIIRKNSDTLTPDS